jgi:hypothetical protein
MIDPNYSVDPLPGLDRDHPAVVRPGEAAPHGPPAVLPVYNWTPLDQAIIAAYELRRKFTDAKFDASWPRLHITLDLALVDLEKMHDRDPADRAVAHRLQWIIHLLDLDRVVPHPAPRI